MGVTLQRILVAIVIVAKNPLKASSLIVGYISAQDSPSLSPLLCLSKKVNYEYSNVTIDYETEIFVSD